MSVPTATLPEGVFAPIPVLSPFREDGRLTNAVQSVRCSEAAARTKEFLLDVP